MKLGVWIIGQEPFRRYMIVRDNDGVVEFWDGRGWARRNGVLYYSEQHLAPDYERLELEQTEGLPERHFETKAIIRVRSGRHFSLQCFKEAMYAAARLHLGFDEYGKGPVPGSSTLIDVLWNEATEVSQPPQREGLTVRVFQVPVRVRVRSVHAYGVSSLKRYLAVLATLHVDHDRSGSKPFAGLTHAEIDWTSLKEVSSEPEGRTPNAPGFPPAEPA